MQRSWGFEPRTNYTLSIAVVMVLLRVALVLVALAAPSSASVESMALGSIPASFDLCKVDGAVFGGSVSSVFNKLNLDMMKSDPAKLNEMRDSLQGYRGKWDKDQFKNPGSIDFQGYTTGLAVFVAPGLILALLTMLCCVPFTVGRFFRDCGNLTPCCACDDKLGVSWCGPGAT